MAAHVRALTAGTSSGAQGVANNVLRQAPLHIFTGHKDEGFAIDWSPITPGRLVTGTVATVPLYQVIAVRNRVNVFDRVGKFYIRRRRAPIFWEFRFSWYFLKCPLWRKMNKLQKGEREVNRDSTNGKKVLFRVCSSLWPAQRWSQPVFMKGSGTYLELLLMRQFGNYCRWLQK